MKIDVHCHLDLKQFEKDLPEAIERAGKAGVGKIIQNSLNPESIRASLALAEIYDSVKLALGLYPVDALKLNDEQIDSQVNLIRNQIRENPKVIAIGEVGLDYHWVKDRKDHLREKRIFGKFIALAEETKRPLIIHSRESEQDAFDMLHSSNAKAIFHCFNGNLQLAKKAEENGYFFSIPASITFLKHFQELVQQTDMKQLFCETDAPYMSPHRGKRNEPAFVAESYKKIAEIKKMSIEDVEDAILKNFEEVFR